MCVSNSRLYRISILQVCQTHGANIRLQVAGVGIDGLINTGKTVAKGR
nr:MAG TPA: hypothetical protein [Caudoviricetes sp.]